MCSPVTSLTSLRCLKLTSEQPLILQLHVLSRMLSAGLPLLSNFSSERWPEVVLVGALSAVSVGEARVYFDSKKR